MPPAVTTFDFPGFMPCGNLLPGFYSFFFMFIEIFHDIPFTFSSDLVEANAVGYFICASFT
jgi:hypothetical protein